MCHFESKIASIPIIPNTDSIMVVLIDLKLKKFIVTIEHSD